MVNFSTLLPPSKLGYLRKFIPPLLPPYFLAVFQSGKTRSTPVQKGIVLLSLSHLRNSSLWHLFRGCQKNFRQRRILSSPKMSVSLKFLNPPPRLKVSNILENLARFSRVLCLLKNWFSDFIFVDWLVSYANQNASSSWILKYFLRVEKKNQVCVKESEDSIFDRCRLLYLS